MTRRKSATKITPGDAADAQIVRLREQARRWRSAAEAKADDDTAEAAKALAGRLASAG